MAITSRSSSHSLASFVSYDEYDGIGFFLDIRHGLLHELNEGDTHLIGAIFSCDTVEEAILSLLHFSHGERDALETDVFSLVERLLSQGLLEPRVTASTHATSSPARGAASETKQAQKNVSSWKRRLLAGAHVLSVLHELCQDSGVYKACLYLQKLSKTKHFLSTEAAFDRIRSEYWWYRLVTGLVERRVAHLLGQAPGEEGLCMVRACALCAHLLALDVPASVVIGRPLYGCRNGFKLHVWVEMRGEPLNECPNIRDAYRVMYEFPL